MHWSCQVPWDYNINVKKKKKKSLKTISRMYPCVKIPFSATLALYQDMQETWLFTLDPKLYHKIICIR